MDIYGQWTCLYMKRIADYQNVSRPFLVFGSRRNLVLTCVSQVSILQVVIIKVAFVNDCIGMIIMY